jgi:hypothetical protein
MHILPCPFFAISATSFDSASGTIGSGILYAALDEKSSSELLHY